MASSWSGVRTLSRIRSGLLPGIRSGLLPRIRHRLCRSLLGWSLLGLSRRFFLGQCERHATQKLVCARKAEQGSPDLRERAELS